MKKLLPQRKDSSHKGQNGRLVIVGGSREYSGAPILASLAALYSGVDQVFLFVPQCNFDVSRAAYPDLIVRPYSGDFLDSKDVREVVDFAKEKADSILIGPGLGGREETVNAVVEILKELPIPTVLDANGIMALKKIEKFPLPQPVVVTPHKREFEELIDREMEVSEMDSNSIIFLRSLSMDLHINVLLKGAQDYVSSVEGKVEINDTGNPGMTVGGSGDVLAGLAASLMAQGVDAFNSARVAAFYNGKAGDYLKKQKGYNFSASDLALALPYVLR